MCMYTRSGVAQLCSSRANRRAEQRSGVVVFPTRGKSVEMRAFARLVGIMLQPMDFNSAFSLYRCVKHSGIFYMLSLCLYTRIYAVVWIKA